MKPIFTFGSNRAGYHGLGAALFAKEQRGAIYGQGEGLQGDSYGIPTKDENIRTLPLPEIAKHVAKFLEFARAHSELTFELTPIACGLAGYKPAQIAPMFKGAPANILMPEEFKRVLGATNVVARQRRTFVRQ